MDNLTEFLLLLKNTVIEDPSVYFIILLILLVSSIPYAIVTWVSTIIINIENRGFLLSWGAVLFHTFASVTLLLVFICFDMTLNQLTLLSALLLLELLVFYFCFSTSVIKAFLIVIIQSAILMLIGVIIGILLHLVTN